MGAHDKQSMFETQLGRQAGKVGGKRGNRQSAARGCTIQRVVATLLQLQV